MRQLTLLIQTASLKLAIHNTLKELEEDRWHCMSVKYDTISTPASNLDRQVHLQIMKYREQQKGNTWT